MVQWEKGLAPPLKPGNLNSIIRTHMLERFNFLKESFDLQMCAKE